MPSMGMGGWILRSALYFGLLCGALALAASFVGASPTTVTLVADAYVRSDRGDRNYGHSSGLRVDGEPITDAYLRFDVAVPEGESITKATLMVHTDSDSNSGITAHPVPSYDWDEETITYDNAPGMGAAVASSGRYNAGGYISLDVTELVAGGPVSIGLKRRRQASNWFPSREAGSNHPRLVVETAPTPDTTPPDTTITGKPANPTNDAQPTFEFGSTESGTFECRVDDDPFGACVSPQRLEPLSDGTHTFEVRAADEAGNADPSPAAYAFGVDTTEPAQPQGLMASPAGGTVTLEWDDSTDPDLSHYQVLRSMSPGGPYSYLASVTASSYTDASETDGATYHYVVEAIDGAENKSGFSNEAAPPPPAAPAPDPDPEPVLRAPDVPAEGAYFGTYVGESSTGRTLFDTEELLGRRFAIVHDYRRWNQGPFIKPRHEHWAADGRVVFMNWHAKKKDLSPTFWADIASGQHDARIDEVAREVKLFARPMFITFNHEPEDEVGVYGAATDFAAAFRHIVERFDQNGADNVAWVWNVMGTPKYYHQYAEGLYPGDGVVDWIAWDPYNWVDCNGWSGKWFDFGATVKDFYAWLMDNGHSDKPFMLGEYGSDEPLAESPTKNTWFLDARDTLNGAANEGTPRFPNLKALVYFDSDHRYEPSGCAWHVDSTDSSLAAFRAMGADPYLQATDGE